MLTFFRYDNVEILAAGKKFSSIRQYGPHLLVVHPVGGDGVNRGGWAVLLFFATWKYHFIRVLAATPQEL